LKLIKMSFRKEKKYRLTYSDIAVVQQLLFKNGMKELYPSRIINSCYFDTENMSLFHDSEEGVLPRKKVRIRWYDNNLNLNKEIKISSLEGRHKVSKKFNKINKIEDLYNLNLFDETYGKLIPTLIVSYKRFYFNLDKLRITFDKNISYLNIKTKIHQKINDDECVMEAKVPLECSDDYIDKMISQSTSRFSKYSRGLLYFYK
tara:strand:+ start:3289 stop:3897 length:609 start_codon:yes stop_codon:yes gene_type:complete